MTTWEKDSLFYHIYPLGLCGAPEQNDFSSAPIPRLEQIGDWIEHLQGLGVNALYLGPVFESTSHGYDTSDYGQVDRRLGTNETLIQLVNKLHSAGIRVILDGVFHHVGRDFWAFRDLQAYGEHSRYRDWFSGVDFSKRSPYNDTFAYAGWNGYYNLVKLNLANPELRNYLFEQIRQWIILFKIDGLRLDAADVIALDFLQALASFCRSIAPDFYLLGEVIHGDYRRWANPSMLDTTTNYECYKGLYSSHNDKNYFEIAYSLNRLFGPDGLYRGLHLYNFTDNHDVDRVASTLNNPRHLYPLYALLFCIPGAPSIYYGSEWGITGRKAPDSDAPLRPALPFPPQPERLAHPDLLGAIQRLATIRQQSPALRTGDYAQLYVNHEQFAFARFTPDDYMVVAVNSAEHSAQIEFPVDLPDGSIMHDLLAPHEQFVVQQGRLRIPTLYPNWARILRRI